jgi:hypothetical protein
MKNLFLIILITLVNLIVAAQVKSVNATGGVGVIDWNAEFKKAEGDDPERAFLYGSGCTEAPQKTKASSALAAQGLANYSASNLNDWDPRTAWVEGKSDYGIGEYFEVDLPLGGYGIGIFNGYQKSQEAWKNNSRVKKFKVYGDGKLLCFVVLKDLMGYQEFSIPSDVNYSVYRFEIAEVYPGAKWKDVAISEIANMGCCFNATTIVRTDLLEKNADAIKVNDKISTIDIETNQLSSSTVLRIAHQKHNFLLRVETENHWIELTPYHPLHFKDYGFTSFLKLQKSGQFATYEEMIDQLEVLIWKDESQTAEYEKITQIASLTGEFDTYSILEIDQTSTYIINGFITSLYPVK